MRARQQSIGFAGTPEFACKILAALIEDERHLAVVYTQPDRKAGRGRRIQANPVKQLAQTQGLAIEQPESLRNSQAPRVMAGYELDVLVVAAYGLILPQAILDVPRLGCINVHASLLPRWRGAAPIERAIMAGDSETGVSIMHMDAGLDTGPVYATRKCPISDTTDGPTLEAQLAESGATLLLECLNDLDKREPKAQAESGATYAKKLSKADATVDWNLDAVVIDRQIRALCGRQPATVVLGNLRIKLLKARANSDTAPGAAPGTIVRSGRDGIIVACASGSITLLRVQLNTGKGSALDPLAACNGYPETFSPGASLASNH